ncbi:hypothetical protein Tco_1441123, partial [Tanacetum coccineum]
DKLEMEMEMEIPSSRDINAQDGDPLQDDVRLCLGDDLKKAQDHNQRQVKDESKDHYPKWYWNDLFANLTLILVGLRVSRDSLTYNEYGIRLMLAPRSAKALQEKVLLKLHGIRKLPGSLSFGGTLFWNIAELSSLRKAVEICSILCLLLISS